MFNKKITNKNIYSHYGELIMYLIAMLLLCFVFIYHYYVLIQNVVDNHNVSDLKTSQDSIKAITSIAIELFSTVGIVGFFFIWYYTYYSRKIRTRTVSKQKQLDKAFRLLNATERANLQR
jgi:hypothetical protein